MIYRSIKYVITVVCLLAGLKTSAQSIEFSANASKTTVAADESFKLVYKVNADGSFIAPDLKDFKQLSAPSSSSYTQIQMYNGQMHNAVSLTWTILVRPKKEGEFTIPPAGVNVGGKVYKSNPIKITVTKATGNSAVDNTPDQNGNVKNNNSKNVFCNIEISKKKVYEGEPVLITYKLYSRFTQIQDYDIKLGTQKDVWSQEVAASKSGWPSYEETVNGIRYMVFPIKKEIVFPQKSGNIKLEPFDMMVVARVSFFESNRFDLVSNSPTLEVLPMPVNAPTSFKNAVGKFTLEASINKEEVNVNDGIDLTVKLKGTGNIKLISAPEFNFPVDFEVYDPETNDKISVNANGMTGSKEYKYLVIPRHSGNYTIEPFAFTYFDLQSKNYVTLYTPEFKIKVNKVAGQEEEAAGGPDKTDVQILDKEIRYLKKYESLEKGVTWFTGTGLYYTAIGAPLVCYLLLVFLVKRRKEKYDPVQERNKNAGKKVVKQLQKAQQMLSQQNTSEFYTELIKGLQAYYCDKFNLEVVDFNRQRIRESLLAKGVSEETVSKFIALIDNCEMARYASFMQGNERATYEEAVTLVNQIETEVKA